MPGLILLSLVALLSQPPASTRNAANTGAAKADRKPTQTPCTLKGKPRGRVVIVRSPNGGTYRKCARTTNPPRVDTR